MDNKADVIVFQMPVRVRVTCPHCEYDIKMSYEDFTNLMGSDYPGDWDGQKIKCDSCKKEIEINDNEWD